MIDKEKLNKLKNELFNELDPVSTDNNKLRYSKDGGIVHKKHFEDSESNLGWYIYWGKDINNILDYKNFEIRSFKNTITNDEKVIKLMLETLDKPTVKKEHRSNSISAAITDINNNVIFVARNIKSGGNSTSGHAEQLVINEMKKSDLDLPINKLKIFVTLIPCIECFEKIILDTSIEEIIYLKDYRSTLVLAQHRRFTNNIKGRNYTIRTKSLKSEESRRICFHHDAYLLDKRLDDVINKKWFKSENGIFEIDISEIGYIDFEKISILIKYVSDEVVELVDDYGGKIKINKDKFVEAIKNFKKLYKGEGKNNKLVNHIEKYYYGAKDE